MENSMSEKRIKRPIQRMVITGSIAFVVILIAVLIFASNRLLQKALTDRYEDRFTEILTYTSSIIDVDDLKECIRTGQPSEKYEHLQMHFDYMLDDFDLDHFYCVVASNTTIWNVVTAVSKEDRDAGEQHLGINKTYGFFPQKELQRYVSFWKNDHISFFEELTRSGLFFTAAMPVKDSEGDTVALICVDVSVTTLNELLQDYIVPVVILIVLICLSFLIALTLWVHFQVTKPIGQLEQSVRNYADQSHMLKDIDDLKLELPDIHTKNEVESLSVAIGKMSDDMQDYVKDVLSAETRAKSAEREALDMTRIAYRDALTMVSSKAAYDLKVEELEASIAKGDAEFGLIMIDLNNLKLINDNFGHDKGDEYLIGACRLLCHVFVHSPVYRIGGDEFIVVLQGEDYDNRADLFDELTEEFTRSRSAADLPLWKCYSAAGGMAVYSEGESFEDVFRHADVAMYEDKQKKKTLAARGELTDRCLTELGRGESLRF